MVKDEQKLRQTGQILNRENLFSSWFYIPSSNITFENLPNKHEIQIHVFVQHDTPESYVCESMYAIII